jgi:DnaJ-domain-containing protein 1
LLPFIGANLASIVPNLILASCEEASMTTLYELLGVCPDAGDEALKTAYRRLAKTHHPDLNPNDPDAARRFRQITAAIAVLSDAERRAAYDHRLVRELQRGLDRERERCRRQRACIVATSAVAVLIGIVAMTVGPVSSTSVVASRKTYDVVQQPVSISTAQQESVSRERPSEKIQLLPAVVPPPQTSTNDRREVSVPLERHCQHETGPHCEPLEGSESDRRELSANERERFMRQAQELLASGDAKAFRVLSQRACRSSRSRCGPGLREDL